MSESNDALKSALFVGANGYVTCIDKNSGDEVWRTSLPGSGYQFVNVLLEGEQIFAGSGGKLYCLWANSGEVVWINNMKGLGYGIFGFATAQAPQGNVAPRAAQKAATSQNSNTTSH